MSKDLRFEKIVDCYFFYTDTVWYFLDFSIVEIVFYIFASVTFIQFCYYLFLFRRLAFYKVPVKETSQQHPVSVIVCARDEDENLARNLPGMLVQTYPSTFDDLVNLLPHSAYPHCWFLFF